MPRRSDVRTQRQSTQVFDDIWSCLPEKGTTFQKRLLDNIREHEWGKTENKRTFPLCPQRFRTWPPVDTQKAIRILKGSAPRSEQHGIFLQNVTFNPTWICRDSIVVAVTRPAEGAGAPEVVNTMGAGIPKPAWLKRLKNSARNCKFHRSVKRVALKRERSNDRNPGPINIFRPAFP